MGRIAGDTAIVVVLLGATLQLDAGGGAPVLGTLRGTGSTLTSYVYNNSPAGEGNAAEEGLRRRVRAAADRARRSTSRRPASRPPRKGPAMELMTPPPVRRLPLEPATAPRRPPSPSRRPAPRRAHRRAARAARRAPTRRRSSACASRSCVAYGGKLAVKRRVAAGPPGRGARADRAVGLRQDDAAALAQPAHRADADGALASGRITLDGDDIDALEVTALRRRVTMVFQQPNPFPMSVFDNVAYALREQAARRPRSAPRSTRAVREALARAGLLRRGRATTSTIPRCGSRAASSSGCASPARSPPQPEVLLLDEPCSALDPRSTAGDRGADRRAARARSRS